MSERTLPAIETIETVLGIRNTFGVLEPIVEGRQYDTRVTPILTLTRTVTWAHSVASEWEVALPVVAAETDEGGERRG